MPRRRRPYRFAGIRFIRRFTSACYFFNRQCILRMQV
jgi:hypothetical protein